MINTIETLRSEVDWKKLDQVIDNAPIVEVCLKRKIGVCDACPLVAHLRDKGKGLNPLELTTAIVLIEDQRCPAGEQLDLRNLSGKKAIW